MGPLSGFVAGSSSWSSRPPAFARQVARSHRDFVRFGLLWSPDSGTGIPLQGCGLVRNGRPEHSLASCPSSRRPRGCGLVWSRGLRGCGLVWSRSLRGCGLVRFRYPDQLLASCPGGRGLRGYDLVRSRRPEHRVEHAEQLPGHRHDGPLLTAGCLNRANRAAHFGLSRTSRQAASTRAHRNSPEPCLVIFRSLDFFSPLCRTTGTSPA